MTQFQIQIRRRDPEFTGRFDGLKSNFGGRREGGFGRQPQHQVLPRHAVVLQAQLLHHRNRVLLERVVDRMVVDESEMGLR